MSISNNSSYQRIISLSPWITETLYELGLENQTIAISDQCLFPYHYPSVKQSVGGVTDFYIEKIEALQPDIVIVSASLTPKNRIDELRDKYKVYVENCQNMDDVLQMLEDFGILFHKRTDAQKWKEKIAFAFKDFLKFMSKKTSRKVAFLVNNAPYTAVASDTYINEVLQWNNFTNIYESLEGDTAEVNVAKMRYQGDPDVVFLSQEYCEFTEENTFEIGRGTHHAKTVFIEGSLFRWRGVRLFQAFDYYKNIQNRLGDE